MGDKLDRKASQALTRRWLRVAAGEDAPLRVDVKVPTVVQINLEGPFDLFYVNPADNPQTEGGPSSTK